MSTDRNRQLAERMWAQLRPHMVEIIADMLDNPPAADPTAGEDEVTEDDMTRIRKAVAAKRARTGRLH